MISIIVGTHRHDNSTQHIAKFYFNELLKSNSQVKLLELEFLPQDFLYRNEIFGELSPEFSEIVDNYIVDSNKFLFVLPEYNGSFPGVLKSFIDCIPPKYFFGKKAAMVGISSGRAGNLRGMEHLTGVLNYLDVMVMPKQLPISRIHTLLDEGGNLVDAETISVIERQLKKFVDF